MVRHGNRGKRAGKRKVRKSGSICLKLVDGSVCRNLPAESAKTRRNYVIDCTDDVNSGAEGAVRAVALSASQNRSRSPASVPAPNRMVKTYWLSIMTLWLLFNVIAHRMTVGMSLKWASTERQRSVNGASTILVWSFRQSKSCIVTSIQKRVIGRLSIWNGKRHACCPIREMSVNGASPISGLAS
jgi:hypothetical protein